MRKGKENEWIYSREQIVHQTKKIVLIVVKMTLAIVVVVIKVAISQKCQALALWAWWAERGSAVVGATVLVEVSVHLDPGQAAPRQIQSQGIIRLDA